ncbi:ubiquinone biosynthesis protein Coq4 [Dichotomocladium elegans]|nr:ubiquinone biosynthesis protein Coq4 [Dichotomocladium elegans]
MTGTRRKLYETHIPITAPQRVMLAVGSAFAALADPLRGDMVAALGETTAGCTLENIRKQMLSSDTGRRILRERPIVHTDTIDFEKLRATCDPGTFGYHYVQWLDHEGVTPDTREPVHYVDDEELGYVMQRYRQVHDFFHTVTGLGVSVEEELALKWFEWAQTGLPMTQLSSIVGPVLLPWEARKRMLTSYIPWALECGANAVPMMCVYFEEHFNTPLHELRRQLRVTPAPVPLEKRTMP